MRAARERELRAFASAIIERAEFATRVGLQYPDPFTGTYRRDMYSALGYQRVLGIKDYRARYERGGITERLVEAFPRATWAGGATVVESHDPEDNETPFEAAVADLAKRLSLWPRMMRADILAGLGRFSVLMIGCDAPGIDSVEAVRQTTEVFARLRGMDDRNLAEIEIPDEFVSALRAAKDIHALRRLAASAVRQSTSSDRIRALGESDVLRQLATVEGTPAGVITPGVGQADFSRPLSESQLSGPDSIKYLTPYPEDRAFIWRVDTNPDSPRFGKPDSYQLHLGVAGVAGIVQGGGTGVVPDVATGILGGIGVAMRLVHWSRCIHIVEGLTENEVFGKPRLRAVWNYLNDLDKVVGGGSESAWRAMMTRLHLKVGKSSDPQAEVDEQEMRRLREAFQELEHDLRSSIATFDDTDIAMLNPAVHNFNVNADALLKLVSATTGIPARIFVGSERGELASTQDRSNWSDRITERRAETAVPNVKQLIDRLIVHGALPEPDGDYEVVWPEIEELDEDQKSTIALRLGQTNQANGSPVMTVDEMRERIYGMEPMPDQSAADTESEGASSDAGGGSIAIAARDPRFLRFDRKASSARSQERARRLLTMRAGGGYRGRSMVSLAGKRKTLTAIHRAADASREAVKRAFRDHWRAVGKLIDTTALRSHRSALEAARAAIASRSGEAKVVQAAVLTSVFERGAREALKEAKARGGFGRKARRAAAFSGDFESANPRAVAWAQEHAGELVTEIDDGAAEGIAALVAQAENMGLTVDELATSVRDYIGLRSDQVDTLTRLADGGATSDELAAHANDMLDYRAEMIARTETMRAALEGQRELWSQAVDDGQLPEDARRVWIATSDDRCCDECDALDGTTAPLDGEYEGGYSGPPAHTSCRCVEGIE